MLNRCFKHQSVYLRWKRRYQCIKHARTCLDKHLWICLEFAFSKKFQGTTLVLWRVWSLYRTAMTNMWVRLWSDNPNVVDIVKYFLIGRLWGVLNTYVTMVIIGWGKYARCSAVGRSKLWLFLCLCVRHIRSLVWFCIRSERQLWGGGRAVYLLSLPKVVFSKVHVKQTYAGSLQTET